MGAEKSVLGRLSAALVGLLIGVIWLYQRLVSAAIRPRCRFVPTCSAYAVESLRKHGVVKGLAKTTWRVCRCHPLGRPGYDPP